MSWQYTARDLVALLCYVLYFFEVLILCKMEAFKACWKKAGNDKRTDMKDA